jgi:C-terminal processing protease CtpA/Prc
MKRLCLIVAPLIVFTWAILLVRSRPSPSSPVKQNLQAALTNPVEFAKERFTGGIGMAFSSNAIIGLPVILVVKTDSPADKAGLRSGDIILKIDGVSTTNTAVPQVAERIKGIASGSVTLTIQRRDTVFDCTVARESWNKLRGLTYKKTYETYETYESSPTPAVRP